MTQRHRPIAYAAIAVLGAWLLAWGGFALARHLKVTGDKVRAYLHSVDLAALNPRDRARALRSIADRLNALSPDERRRARLDHEWSRWFAVMTEEEKTAFVEATMPTGFKQMLTAFESLPEDQRRRGIQDSIRRLREARESQANDNPDDRAAADTNGPPAFSDELQKKIVTMGLKSFYGQSSASTKAEAAPLLEELQRSMESGRLFRRPGPPR